MGANKRPKASKLPQQNHTDGSENPNLDEINGQLDSQKNSTLGGETPQLGKEASSNGISSSRKRAMNQAVVVRRSGRLRSIFRSVRLNNTGPTIEEIEISEDEAVEDEENVELAPPGEIVLEERTDPMLEDPMLEAQNEDEDRETPKSSKGPKKSPKKSQGPFRADLQYRSLYFEAQKKVESLMDENHQLEKKLENALGKLEVYEKGPSLIADAFNNVKGMILVSNMNQVTEAATKLSAEAICKCFDASHAVARKTSSTKRRSFKKKEKGINEL